MLSNATLKKLSAIERHQRAVKRLVDEVETRYGVADTHDESGEPWSAAVDRQGSVTTASGAAVMLERYIAVKARGVGI